MDLIGLYKKMILSLVPDNLEKQLKTDKGTLGDGIKNVILASLVADLLFLIAAGLQFMVLGSMAGMSGDADALAAVGGGFVGIIIVLILIPILAVVSTLITTALAFVLCKILGGKGTFTDQYFHFSIVGSGLMIITSVLNIIPIVGSLVVLVLGLYYLYPTFLVYRGVHKFSNMKAALAVIIPIIVAVILFVALMAYFISTLAAMTQVTGMNY